MLFIPFDCEVGAGNGEGGGVDGGVRDCDATGRRGIGSGVKNGGGDAFASLSFTFSFSSEFEVEVVSATGTPDGTVNPGG